MILNWKYVENFLKIVPASKKISLFIAAYLKAVIFASSDCSLWRTISKWPTFCILHELMTVRNKTSKSHINIFTSKND